MNEFPRRFGPYVLLKPLARGGMGALYLALSGDEDSAKLCVIKTVLPHLADKEYLQRFRDEAKVVVRLSHGNLVPVFDSGQVAGEIYLAMDYVDGRDLRATWNRCAKKGIAFPIDVAAHIVKELARGLYYAHTFGDIKLVHRDVSPPNVLLSYSGEVRLTDFGLAASTLKIEKTAPGIIYGKVSYMSPEQARGEPIDGRTDLYAAGIILWELLTGRQVFPSGRSPGGGKDLHTSEELLRRVRNPEPVAPSRRAGRVPPELDRIALKALAPSLKDRYATCEELRHDLAKFLAQTSPGTDSTRVAKFLTELYGEDIAAERAEREQLILEARQWYTSKHALVESQKTEPLSADEKTIRPQLPPMPGAAADASEPFETPSAPTRDRKVTVPDVMEVSPQPDSSPSARRSTSALGTVIGGRYYVRRLCGEGGMGRVFEAEHIDIGRRVALKILHPGYSQTPDLVERLRREARAASKISHPNVVDVTDSGTTPEGAFFFVMEYLEGIELGELIHREGRLDVRRTLHIGAQICRALQAAHEVSVIHRDLKPENVLILTRDGQRDFVKVLDFGIAKSGTDDLTEDIERDSRGDIRRRLTHPGMTMGTPEYMAPEQAAGRPADPRSDVYAAGGLLYEMLTGKAPYEGANFMEILHKKATTLPAPPSSLRDDVPAQLDALIMKALAKDPADRPQSMDELGRELTALATTLFPNFGYVPTIESEKVPQVGVLGALRDGAARATGLFESIRLRSGKHLALAAGGALGLFVIYIVASSVSHRHHERQVAALSAANRATAPLRPAPIPPSTTAPRSDVAKENATIADDDAPGADDKGAHKVDEAEAAAQKAKAAAHPAGPSAAESKRMLEDGQHLLHAERFSEARELFEKIAKSKHERGPALVGLAEIAFQEKKYDDAVHSAELAADRGGGVRARVLLGDAHFRLGHYKEAAKAYGDALKLDPSNASARSGLALAEKRM
jgi:eukaryotic-like serine/threonine-protein kinase